MFIGFNGKYSVRKVKWIEIQSIDIWLSLYMASQWRVCPANTGAELKKYGRYEMGQSRYRD